jgi:long-chain acyl-CoA synthetase
METSGAVAAFVEDPQTYLTLRDASVRHWILLTGWAEGVMTLEDLREMGREALERDPGLGPRMRAEVRPSDPAILYLTSGATGEPKMALVTHQSIVANIDMGPIVLPLGPEDATVAFLPSAHIAQRVVSEFLPMRSGMPVTFFESLLKLPQDIRNVRPTILLAPPRMWERIYSSICTELRKRPAAARKAFYAGLRPVTGARASRSRCTFCSRSSSPTGCCSARSGPVSAAVCRCPLPAPRPSAKTWPSFTKPSACR